MRSLFRCCLSAMALVLFAGHASAQYQRASSDFCDKIKVQAVSEANLAAQVTSISPVCRFDFTSRFSPNEQKQYDWCMNLSVAEVNAELEARAKDIRACRRVQKVDFYREDPCKPVGMAGKLSNPCRRGAPTWGVIAPGLVEGDSRFSPQGPSATGTPRGHTGGASGAPTVIAPSSIAPPTVYHR